MESKKPLRFGLVGAGRIVRLMINGLKKVPGVEASAVFDYYPGVAQKFADEQGIPNVYTDYEEFLASKAFDVAYIALPHPFHQEYAMRALNAGYHVLCEKPMCPNYAQAKAVADCAKANGRFLMEGTWTRFFPASRQICKWIQAGDIGRIVAAEAAFTFTGDCVPGNRLYEPSLAGGTILDVGIYCIDYLNMVFGREPVRIGISCSKVASGVDDAAAIGYTYDDGAVATVVTTFHGASYHLVHIIGTKGTIESDVYNPKYAKMTNKEGSVTFEAPTEGLGFQYEIAHVKECIEQGLLESPVKPVQASLDIIKSCDNMREQLGIAYPFE